MLDTIINILCDFVEIEPEEITEDSVLRTDIGLNSLDYVSVAQALEQEYNITISNAELTSFKTVGDILNCLNKKIS
ncbi:MAG TPA: acyl carrier protein [Ruminococcaceae bacterium]|nr:acyl carrier protein [Oscillospiraceae bacterium]